jgi:hypothetical protein
VYAASISETPLVGLKVGDWKYSRLPMRPATVPETRKAPR